MLTSTQHEHLRQLDTERNNKNGTLISEKDFEKGNDSRMSTKSKTTEKSPDKPSKSSIKPYKSVDLDEPDDPFNFKTVSSKNKPRAQIETKKLSLSSSSSSSISEITSKKLDQRSIHSARDSSKSPEKLDKSKDKSFTSQSKSPIKKVDKVEKRLDFSDSEEEYDEDFEHSVNNKSASSSDSN